MNLDTVRDQDRRIDKPPARLRLAIEFTGIFVGGPFAILAIHRPGILFIVLWLGAFVALAGTGRGRPVLPKNALRRELRGILFRFAVLSPVVSVEFELFSVWRGFPVYSPI